MNFIKNPGFWGALLAGLGALSVAFGKPAAGAILSDPNTATSVTSLITLVGATIAAFSKKLGSE
jgi:hypothetical protein